MVHTVEVLHCAVDFLQLFVRERVFPCLGVFPIFAFPHKWRVQLLREAGGQRSLHESGVFCESSSSPRFPFRFVGVVFNVGLLGSLGGHRDDGLGNFLSDSILRRRGIFVDVDRREKGGDVRHKCSCRHVALVDKLT